ncbi:MAG: MarC family protein [Candidatus Margulisbacteria bacterium]|nr:MarC family protein [Candidatus Margulisiibacteriota bacterium]
MMELFFWPFIKSVVALFIITDSLGNLPFFLGLTEGETQAEQRKVFTTALITGFVILIGFILLGNALLALFNVTLDDFRIAGGVLLFWIAIEIMLRGRINIEHKEDMGVVPLGSPLLVGPGAITTALVLLQLYGYLVVISAIVACFAVIWLVLFFADHIYAFLGKNGALILTKIASILIAAIAVQFIRQGISAIFHLG